MILHLLIVERNFVFESSDSILGKYLKTLYFGALLFHPRFLHNSTPTKIEFENESHPNTDRFAIEVEIMEVIRDNIQVHNLSQNL